MCKADLEAIFFFLIEEAMARAGKVQRNAKEFISMACTQPIPKASYSRAG